ncbi:HD domain-containing phosphohydrolase [Hydrogenophaga sp.]|uniref:HD-GYP domain-containing protein n=1 Tax=Hydrogenophaga sp. TaxID=1904254 RepID=UPI0025B9B896|nr:HD domain-containing phosphohydrolase [Hydrogenophaga sp.]
MYQLLPEDALVLNQPVPVNLWDPKGVLLLRKGETVATQKQREQIMLRSPGVLAGEWQAVTYGYTAKLDRMVRNNESLSDIAKLSALTVDVKAQSKADVSSPQEAWAELHATLSSLLHQGAGASDFLSRLLRVQQEADHLWQLQPDTSMLVLVQYLFAPRLSYSTTHALLCAGLCQMVAASADLAADTRRRLSQAALTMNLGMTRAHDELARQGAEPTAVQRRMIREHPLSSAAALRELGVIDLAWLRLVEEHHERSDGTGYPAGRRVDSVEHRLLQLADSFVSCVSPRAGRGSLPSQDLARQLYLGFGHTPDRWGALFVKVIGFFPPGSYVRLANGETGVVVRRGQKANTPKVMSLISRMGTPLGEPVLRDTAQAACAVQASLPPGEVKVAINVAQLLARC